ncbi:hypothetical protein COOONC_15855 [Cooperia oncophora]
MDFEAPPPFVGALEEPPDSECDARLTVDDEDDSLRELEIPQDLPCTSSTASSPVSSPVKQKPPDLRIAESFPVAAQSPDHCENGLADGEDDMATPSESIGDKEEDTSACVDILDQDDFDDDFGDFAGNDVDVPPPEGEGLSSELPPKESSAEGCSAPDRYSPVRQPISRTQSQDAEPDEWNAFGAVKECENEGWSADFGAFGEASPKEEVINKAPVVEDAMLPETASSPHLDELCDSMDLWNVDSEIGCDEAYNISEMLDLDASSKERYRGIFSQNAVGRGSLPPLSTSTVLEPTPFTANGTTRRSVIISREEGAYGAKIVASDVSTNPVHNTNNSAVTAESPSIPQADFDWDASDLTNPTKAANRSSALLDVDFLSANSGGGSSSTISTLQKELDQLGLSSSETPTLRKPASQP